MCVDKATTVTSLTVWQVWLGLTAPQRQLLLPLVCRDASLGTVFFPLIHTLLDTYTHSLAGFFFFSFHIFCVLSSRMVVCATVRVLFTLGWQSILTVLTGRKLKLDLPVGECHRICEDDALLPKLTALTFNDLPFPRCRCLFTT